MPHRHGNTALPTLRKRNMHREIATNTPVLKGDLLHKELLEALVFNTFVQVKQSKAAAVDVG